MTDPREELARRMSTCMTSGFRYSAAAVLSYAVVGPQSCDTDAETMKKLKRWANGNHGRGVCSAIGLCNGMYMGNTALWMAITPGTESVAKHIDEYGNVEVRNPTQPQPLRPAPLPNFPPHERTMPTLASPAPAPSHRRPNALSPPTSPPTSRTDGIRALL